MLKLGSYTHSGWVNRALKAALFATAFIVLFAQGSDAATITVNPPDIYGRTFVDVTGDLEAGDDKTFVAKVGRPAEPEKVIVTLMSNGGQFLPAIVIGDFIRLTGMATYVPADKTCASACAFVWLAGAQRMVGGGTKAHIGFHGVYTFGTVRRTECSGPGSADLRLRN